MLSFNFLNFFFQSFVKCSSKSKDNNKKKVTHWRRQEQFSSWLLKKKEKKKKWRTEKLLTSCIRNPAAVLSSV